MNERSKISGSQLMLLISSSVLGSAIALSFMDTITGHDSWLTVLSGYAISIPPVLSYAFLAKRFPGMNIVQINDMVYGPYLGKLISLIYIAFFLLIFALNIRDVANFYIGLVMPETPILAYLIMLVLTCAYAVNNGLETIARINVFALILVVFSLTSTFFLLLNNNMHFTNFFPVFDISLKTYIHGTHIMAAVAFCEPVVFLMVMPYLNNYKQIVKYSFGGLSIAALIFVVTSVRNTAVLGPTALLMVSASYQAVRLINISNILTRIEFLVVIAMTAALFIKICLFYYATVSGISQLLKLRSFSTLILPIGCIAIILAITVYENEIIHSFSARNYHPILVFPIQFILPPVSLLIAALRGLPKQTSSEIQ